MHPADVEHSYAVLTVLGGIAGPLGGIAFCITGSLVSRNSAGKAGAAKTVVDTDITHSCIIRVRSVFHPWLSLLTFFSRGFVKLPHGGWCAPPTIRPRFQRLAGALQASIRPRETNHAALRRSISALAVDGRSRQCRMLRRCGCYYLGRARLRRTSPLRVGDSSLRSTLTLIVARGVALARAAKIAGTIFLCGLPLVACVGFFNLLMGLLAALLILWIALLAVALFYNTLGKLVDKMYAPPPIRVGEPELPPLVYDRDWARSDTTGPKDSGTASGLGSSVRKL